MKTTATAAAVALAFAVLSQPADAAIITVTVDGTLSSGRDDFNYFGAGANLAGQSARIIFTFDDETPGATLVNSGDNQYVQGFGPDYANWSCCSPGEAITFINGIHLDNNGTYNSRFTKSYVPGPVGWDTVQALSQVNHYIYESGAIRYGIYKYGYISITGAEILEMADLRQSIDFIGGSKGANISGGFQYSVWDYANPGYVQRIDAVFSLIGTTVSIVGPDGPPPVGGVPEPASWALLIAGFGFIGAAMRRRRSTTMAA